MVASYVLMLSVTTFSVSLGLLIKFLLSSARFILFICSRILSPLFALKLHLSALVCSCIDANSSRSTHLFGFLIMCVSKILNMFSEFSFYSAVNRALLIISRSFGPVLGKM